MEASAEDLVDHFLKTKAAQQRVLKQLGHPVKAPAADSRALRARQPAHKLVAK